jgi:glycosyltransferase involved in cell wall biosynthesis
MITDLVSIIIPTRPGRPLLVMPSLEKQTYQNIEILIRRDYGHEGSAVLRNDMIFKAGGGYILNLDDDMVMEPNMIERMVKALEENHDCAFAYCNYHRTGNLRDDFFGSPWDPGILRKHNIADGKSLCRRQLFDRVRFDKGILRLLDWDLWLSAAKEGLRGIWINEFLFTSIYNGDTLSERPSWDHEFWEKWIRAKHGIEVTA